jgi:hypothetical protein
MLNFKEMPITTKLQHIKIASFFTYRVSTLINNFVGAIG